MKTRILFLLLLLAIGASAQSTRPTVDAVLRIGMTVEEMDWSVEFFSKVLDFEKTSDVEIAGEEYEKLLGVFGLRCRVVRMRLGEESIELTQFLTPRGRTVPRDSRSNDRWFQHIAIVTTDMDRDYARLRKNKVRHASTGPQTLPDWNPAAGGIRAFYFHDPDYHVLEIIFFPPGKGDPRWQKSQGLFAGIDHTAIVVQDTAKSLAFYRDRLGMKVVGESENHGTEQAHLNNVEGARLRITSLRAAAGPGVEFLEYLSPRDGRPYPADAKANDLFHWQTTFSVARPESSTNNLMIRDPDGHAILLTQPSRKEHP